MIKKLLLLIFIMISTFFFGKGILRQGQIKIIELKKNHSISHEMVTSEPNHLSYLIGSINEKIPASNTAFSLESIQAILDTYSIKNYYYYFKESVISANDLESIAGLEGYDIEVVGNINFNHIELKNRPQFTLIGYSDINKAIELNNNSFNITEGSLYMDESDCIISKYLARLNNLSIGDRLLFHLPVIEKHISETEVYDRAGSDKSLYMDASVNAISPLSSSSIIQRFTTDYETKLYPVSLKVAGFYQSSELNEIDSSRDYFSAVDNPNNEIFCSFNVIYPLFRQAGIDISHSVFGAKFELEKQGQSNSFLKNVSSNYSNINVRSEVVKKN